MNQIQRYLTILSFLLFSCGQNSVDLQNFEEEAWRTDQSGCGGLRLKMRDELIRVKSQLKGFNENQIMDVLGKPNKINLVDRNQKYYIYNISCPTQNIAYSTLSIRFNAVGLSYEALVY